MEVGEGRAGRAFTSLAGAGKIDGVPSHAAEGVEDG
jgi:hypothetical protein